MPFAICIVGHVGAWATDSAVKQSFIDHVSIHSPDIFIETYDEETFKPCNANPMDARSPTTYDDTQITNMFTGIGTVKHLNREIVDASWCTDRYNESQVYRRGPVNNALTYKTYNLLRKINLCYTAMAADPANYDVVLVTRPNVTYSENIDISVSAGWFYCAPFGGPQPQDAVVLGTRTMMDIFNSRWSVLPTMYTNITYIGAPSMDPHILFWYVCSLNGCDGKWNNRIKVDYKKF